MKGEWSRGGHDGSFFLNKIFNDIGEKMRCVGMRLVSPIKMWMIDPWLAWAQGTLLGRSSRVGRLQEAVS